MGKYPEHIWDSMKMSQDIVVTVILVLSILSKIDCTEYINSTLG